MNDIPGETRQAETPRKGVIVFHSKIEFPPNTLCKLYQIDETHGICDLGDHTHNYFQIWYVQEGEFLHTVNRNPYLMVQGDLFVIPPNVVHRVQRAPGKNMRIIGLEFLPQFINERFVHLPSHADCFDFHYIKHFMVSEDQLVPKAGLTGGPHLNIKWLLEDMLSEYKRKKPFYEMTMKGSLLRLLSLIMREYADRSRRLTNRESGEEKYRRLIDDALDYIHNHYQEEIRLNRLCKMLAISRTYFCFFFKKHTGKTFNEYVIHLRIQKSAELLLRSNLSVTEICYHVGLNDLTYFSKMFKKYKGVTPSYYKKQAVGDIV